MVRRIRIGRVQLYIEPGDLWFGAFIPRDLSAVYICLLPMCVIRIRWRG